jgi:hypothetical protein
MEKWKTTRSVMWDVQRALVDLDNTRDIPLAIARARLFATVGKLIAAEVQFAKATGRIGKKGVKGIKLER